MAAIFVRSGLAADAKVVRSPRLQRMGVATTDVYGTYQILDNPNDTYRLHIKAHSFDQVSKNVIVRLGKGEKKGVIGAYFIRIGLSEKLPSLEHGYEDVQYTCQGGDNGPFCRAGIPCVWPSSRPYMGILHTAFDSIEHMDYDLLTESAKKALGLLQPLIRAAT